MKNYGLAVLIGCGFCLSAQAGTFSFNPEPVTAVRGAPSSFVVSFASGGTDEAQFDASFDDAGITIAAEVLVPGSVCGVNVGGNTIRVVPPSGAGTSLPAAATQYCRFTLQTDAAAAVGIRAVTTNFIECAGSGAPDAACTFTTAGIDVTDAPPVPPTVTFAPNGGAVNLSAPGGALAGSVSNASVIAVTAVGGTGAGTGSYTCADPGAPFTVTNLVNGSIAVGSDPDDLSATCTLGLAAVSRPMACQRTGAVATPVNFTLNCPAGLPAPIPQYSSNPAPGSTITCNGAPGSQQFPQLTISNTGIAGVGSNLDYTCTVSGAGFTLESAGAASVAVGASSIETFGCLVPAEGEPAATGSVTCTSNDAANSPAEYSLSSSAATAPPAIPQPNVVPASSLWSQLSLIGLLAALGLLVVGLRRNH